MKKHEISGDLAFISRTIHLLDGIGSGRWRCIAVGWFSEEVVPCDGAQNND